MFLHIFTIENRDDWIVVSTSESGKHIIIWTINKPKNQKNDEILHNEIGNLFLEKSIDSSNQITSVCPSLSLFVGEQKKNLPFHFITGGIDGYIRTWKININSQENIENPFIKLEEILSCKISKKSILQIRCASFGFFATLSSSAEESIFEIFIWKLLLNNSVENSQIQLIKTWKSNQIQISKISISFDWLPLYDGNNILAIGYGQQIKLLSQLYKESQMFGVEWEETDLSIPQFVDIQNIIWTMGGSLICSSSNQIYVFTKWLKEKYDEYKDIQFGDIFQQLSSNSTIFHLKSFEFRPLPFYHPKILIQYLISGNFEKVGTILKHLLKFTESSNQNHEKSSNELDINDKVVKFIPNIPLENLISIGKNNNQKVIIYIYFLLIFIIFINRKI